VFIKLRKVEQVFDGRRRLAGGFLVLLATFGSVAVGALNRSVGAQACDPGGGNNARSVEFANLGSTAVEVRWVNFQCGETLYTTVRGGSSYVQQTFQSHLWRFYEVGTGRLLKEERIAAQTRIEFGDPAVAAPKPTAVPVATPVPTDPPTTTAANPVPVFPGAGAQTVRGSFGGLRCSPGGGNQKRDITFKNATAETIEVWWVAFDCQEVLYATMPPGSQYLQRTYISHQWRFYEAPGGSVSKIVCAAVPADTQCFNPSLPGGGSALYKIDTILNATDLIEIDLPPTFDPKWRPVMKAKASGANKVIFSWAVPAGAPGACYMFSALVRKGTVEQPKPQACIAIPPDTQTMSVTVAIDPAKVTKLRQTKQPLTYSATTALSIEEPGGPATGLSGSITK
jgi:VHL beta domain